MAKDQLVIMCPQQVSQSLIARRSESTFELCPNTKTQEIKQSMTSKINL